MSKLEYVKFSAVSPHEFKLLLNKESTRKHLINYERFDLNSAKTWIQEKVEMDSIKGCKLRGIVIGSSLAGWCGIQVEDGQYEIAIVLDKAHWGIGKIVFYDMLLWAKKLGHTNVNIHFLHTRPEYKFLRKISSKVYKSKHYGREFTTYQLSVNAILGAEFETGGSS